MANKADYWKYVQCPNCERYYPSQDIMLEHNARCGDGLAFGGAHDWDISIDKIEYQLAFAIDCVECGRGVYTRFGDDYMRVFECEYCGRVYDASNYTIDEWADMFDLDPVAVASERGIEYTPDSDTAGQ